jgi:hypothetical protein
MISPAKAQILKSYIKSINISDSSMGIIISGDIKSKSRPGISHYSRIIIDPMSNKIIKSSCDCEAFTFRKSCWHLELLEYLARTEYKNEIEKAREYRKRLAEEALNW